MVGGLICLTFARCDAGGRRESVRDRATESYTNAEVPGKRIPCSILLNECGFIDIRASGIIAL